MLGRVERLFVGLGNPGRDHARQRHNVGFMAVAAVAASHDFGRSWRRFRGTARTGRIQGTKVLALCPGTWMNLSGEAVGLACRYHKLTPAQVTVFYDDLDLAPGKVRVKRGGGSGGHRGIESVDRNLGRNYRRVRIGIGRPPGGDVANRYVLKNFGKAELQWLEPLLAAIAEAAPLLISDRDDQFMNRVLLNAPPPAAETP